MFRAVSKDGTSIGANRSGRGLPLVLVHGIASDAARWAPVMPALEEHFAVYAMDRRGRGSSGDSTAYDLRREIEDVGALVDAIGEPAFLFGHSFGGLCALHTLLVSENVRSLVVYEPYVPVVAAREPSEVTLRFEAMAASDDREGVVSAFLRGIVQLSETELAQMRAHASWAARIAAAHTIPRELGAAERFDFQPSRFAATSVPITMFVGSESPAFLKDATDRIHAALPASRVVVLEGQRHAAMNTAPMLFVQELLAAFASA